MYGTWTQMENGHWRCIGNEGEFLQPYQCHGHPARTGQNNAKSPARIVQTRIIGQNAAGLTLEAIRPNDKTTVYGDNPTGSSKENRWQAIGIAVGTAAVVIALLWYAFKK